MVFDLILGLYAAPFIIRGAIVLLVLAGIPVAIFGAAVAALISTYPLTVLPCMFGVMLVAGLGSIMAPRRAEIIRITPRLGEVRGTSRL